MVRLDGLRRETILRAAADRRRNGLGERLTFFKRAENGKRHRHEFLVKLENVLAVWTKRGEGDEVYFRGTLRQCTSCDTYRFRAPGLREVEVTR